MTRAYTKHTSTERMASLRVKFLALENKKLKLIARANRLRMRVERIADQQQNINNRLEKSGASNAPVA